MIFDVTKKNVFLYEKSIATSQLQKRVGIAILRFQIFIAGDHEIFNRSFMKKKCFFLFRVRF